MPLYGKKIIIFLDDLNMPKPDNWGTQNVLELLRQIICYSGFYDLKKLNFNTLTEVTFLTSCALPGEGRNHITNRCLRYLH